ncbi:MAG: DUF1573 domain-containing protein [Xanthomonadaceae bacterium]|nr:DUF1573 domain-containing protein [Xanthomonadaceae bacterium]
MVLQNNGGDEQVVTADGGFSFSPQDDGSSFDVTVATQPTNLSQTCTVTNGSGTLAGVNVTNVEVACTTNQFTVSGTDSGLAGDQVVLQNNGGDDQVVTTDGGFAFSPQNDGTTYEVTVATQPTNPSQACTVTNGSGTLAGADVTNVAVDCATIQIELDQSTLEFGNLILGQSATLTITITNTGEADLLISEITDPDSPFALVGGSCLPAPGTLAAMESCTIDVEFSPERDGFFVSSFQIESNAGSSPDTVTMSGTAIAPLPVSTLNPWALIVLMLSLLLFAGLRLRIS